MSSGQRRTTILSYLLPVLLALTFFSLSSNSFRRAPWYEEVLWNVVTPLQRVMVGVSGAIGGAWHHYVALGGAQRERDDLSRRVLELEAQLTSMSETEAENTRLRSLLDYPAVLRAQSIVARVIAGDARPEFKSITINKGSKAGIRTLMPVVGPKGLVGKVGVVSGGWSRVLLITDPMSAVDAMVQRSRERGLLAGSAWKTTLRPGAYVTRFEYLRGMSDLEEGDVVLTTGLDRVFPAGIPIGTVGAVSASRYGVFLEAEVLPYENMAELSEVMVLLTPEQESDETSSPEAQR
jgi:rod shape-determining protein MreC